MPAAEYDFFVSYTEVDRAWAEWIAWQLKTAGYSVCIQAWHFDPGRNFVAQIQRAIAQSRRVLCVASAAYFRSRWTQDEWTAPYYRDPNSLLPVRIEPVELPGLLGPISYVDIFDMAEDRAREKLLEALEPAREPSRPPAFPPQERPRFPGRPSDAGHLPESVGDGAEPSPSGLPGTEAPAVEGSRKRELRGTFDGFKAKAAKAGRAEDPTLIALCEAAHGALYDRERYDEVDAARKVQAYINAVNTPPGGRTR